jgi:hypothetical protein
MSDQQVANGIKLPSNAILFEGSSRFKAQYFRAFHRLIPSFDLRERRDIHFSSPATSLLFVPSLCDFITGQQTSSFTKFFGVWKYFQNELKDN